MPCTFQLLYILFSFSFSNFESIEKGIHFPEIFHFHFVEMKRRNSFWDPNTSNHMRYITIEELLHEGSTPATCGKKSIQMVSWISNSTPAYKVYVLNLKISTFSTTLLQPLRSLVDDMVAMSSLDLVRNPRLSQWFWLVKVSERLEPNRSQKKQMSYFP